VFPPLTEAAAPLAVLEVPPLTEANLPLISFASPATTPPKLGKLCLRPATTLCEPVRVSEPGSRPGSRPSFAIADNHVAKPVGGICSRLTTRRLAPARMNS
jgi:hypothetical protein